MNTSTRARRRALLTGSAAFAVAALVTPMAMAGTTSGNLPNGAEITVGVTSPVDGDSFIVPSGDTTIDVPLSGTSSVATGAPSTSWIYVVDVSGSTSLDCDASRTILTCEKVAVKGLNDLVVTDGSALESAVAAFGEGADTADMQGTAGDQKFTSPSGTDVNTVVDSLSAGSIGQFTGKNVGADFTNYAAGLQAASALVSAASGTQVNVVFLSDGESNAGAIGDFTTALTSVSAGATIYPFAVGSGSSCGGGTAGTLNDMATASGTTCFAVPDPADLPDVITNVTGTTLKTLSVTLDGNPAASTPSTALPTAGPASITWTAPGDDLAPGLHQVCATATGVGPASDATATGSATRCESFSVFGFTLTPPAAINELGSDNVHTVTATVTGPASDLGGHSVDFSVSAGPNAGESGTCAPAACETDATGHVTFTYDVPKEPASLGTDTISATATIHGDEATRTVSKLWRDTTPPIAQCVPSTNPGGHVPAAPGNGGQGQNQDGFYRLVAHDDVWPDSDLDLFVKDDGSSQVWGPFAVDTDIKYTEANGAKPSQKPGSGTVEWNLKGKGDAELYAIDGSGNQSASVKCLVPSAPK
ncbi:hypothetical protein [Janibacter sp. HTCC2649]|uniref:hypothetical protein n=1 Tax=Janibacter sp. HTCC2649 TaxID=313589 RepID=UPI000323C5F5|nr:hypothetical protein [Janibacter sp. HTCC2649]